MKKTLIYSVLAMGSMVGISSANAELENSLSVGYAWSSLGVIDEKNKLKTNKDAGPKGINLKYRYEIDNQLGIITSFTYLRKKDDLLVKIGSTDINYSLNFNYYSLLIGPTYRFNEWVSGYAALGFVHSKVKEAAKFINIDEKADNKKNGFAGMIGFQVNPMTNIVIDGSFEYAKSVYGKKAKVWSIGLGYRF
ncbi:Ail/Lom family outer membrane beta-barrel protein [Candidatus Williamhamiltonella defendens]|uniref:Outer membrane protease, receptor for phage OX2 n=1 Tax=Hamiltonella defensa subsp. Acyrthosiphon pisum (strain 5AT) TaxID=572265 RepID=C4K7T9_HAMD5|nr:Ail/Lom family outer membrane beta-barrel protein [Candidatus Hamiltonella defensa]ACQ68632.1 outer membrane protease, receptor for phage OX2 [Candidatus Hamiltonella defensa 5AT (Acyrthosiphon pisum)]ATW23171.1 peptidase [Candidatus Hamiltonella defensa]